MDTNIQIPARHVEMLDRIKAADADLTERFREKMRVNRLLDRTLVSFQANKAEVGHRWCKYREGFSAELIRYIIEETGLTGPVLDPFAGSGTPSAAGIGTSNSHNPLSLVLYMNGCIITPAA